MPAPAPNHGFQCRNSDGRPSPEQAGGVAPPDNRIIYVTGIHISSVPVPRSPDLHSAMTSTLTPSTHRASFAIGSEQSAKRVVDLLNESFFEGQAAISAFESPTGRWDITVHFADAPDQASIRDLV